MMCNLLVAHNVADGDNGATSKLHYHPSMDENPVVTRTVEVELGAEELWELVSDGDAWPEWLVDEASVDVRPGGGGDVLDDGERRRVEVDDVDRSGGVRFRWWPLTEPDRVSIVELVVGDTGRRGVLHIRETLPQAGARAAERWEIRSMLLAVRPAMSRRV